ncbi:MAG: transketolase [Myxococcales bacterium]|nr:transketolase [Myxococcales bacterium]
MDSEQHDSGQGGDPTSLPSLCTQLRIDILEMIHAAGSGHPGGSLSAIDVIATLYECQLTHNPHEPDWPDRDRFILSKGHGAPALYAVLAHRGYFPRARLSSLRTFGSELQGHPVVGTVAGVEACTGSLGQGLSIAQGVALAARLDGRDVRAYCMLGDGELQEGQVWEAALSAAAYGLDGLVAILDLNGGQLDGHTADILPLGDVAAKWTSFGWGVRSIDGHDHAQILDALRWAKGRDGMPKVIIANTVKGKGVPFMEDQVAWHGAAPTDEQLEQALAALRGEGAP